MITTSYHDLLTMYGGEQLEAEQRVYIYVQQPKRYKTPEDIARKDADIARQIEPRAQVKSPEGAEIYWYFPDADSLAAWIDTDNLDTCIQGVLTMD